MRIGFIVEGGTDQGVVPVIAGKILARPVEPVLVFRKGGGFRTMVARNRLETLLRALRVMRVEAAVVVVDNDRRPAGERIVMLEKRVPEDAPRPVVIGVAVEMIEAWLLACPQAFEAVFKKAIRLAKNPEEYEDPKREVIAPYLAEFTAFRSLGRNLGGRIVSAAEYDIECAARACPSLGEFSLKLRKAVGSGREG